MTELPKNKKSVKDPSYLSVLRQKRRDSRGSRNGSSTPELNIPEDSVGSSSHAKKPEKKTMIDDITLRLDEFGFIINLDENGQLQKPVGFVLPGGAQTPSFDLYSTYSALREKDTELNEQNSIDNKKHNDGSSIIVRREKKWAKMLNDWKITKRKKNKLQRRLRKGIPNSVRGQAWVHLQGVKETVEIDQRGFYSELVRRSTGENPLVETVNDVELQFTRSNHKYKIDNSSSHNKKSIEDQNNLVEVIERDIHRTFPRHHLFFDRSGDDTSDENNSCDSDNSSDDSSYDVASEIDKKALRKELDDLENKSLNMEMLLKQSEDTDELTNNSSSRVSNSQKHKCEGIGHKASQHISRVLDQIETGNLACNSVANKKGRGKDKGKEDTKKETVSTVFSSVSSAVTKVKKNLIEPQHVTKKEKEDPDYAVAKGGQASLRRVLRAYNIYDSEVGYCQGMNFIAAMFITYMSEEEAFWMLTAVMNHSPCKMRGLFGEGMSEAHQVLYVAEKLIYLHNPKLAKHLEKENIHVTMYATQWLLTLYTSSFPFALVTRVWDCFLAEGWKVPYRVMLALLQKATPKLMTLHFEEILGYIRELPLKVDGDEIMEIAFKIPLRRKHIQKYSKEYAERLK